MKMTDVRPRIAALIAVALIAGCAINPSAPPPTPAQVVAQLCPIAKEVGVILLAPGALPEKDQAAITKAAPVVEQLCSVGATVTAANLKGFAASSLPGILDIVNGSSLSQADKARIGAGLLIAQLAIASVR